MDSAFHDQEKNIRKIEDIIDIQKAKGNYNFRQVAFNLPTKIDSGGATNIAKSLESGLSKTKCDGITKKKAKQLRSKRHKSPLPDVISWPSDSDITVLRMKLCLTSDSLKDNVSSVIPGDGLHQPDSSSMINLATLIFQSQPPSKHSIIEEYLLPLSSWEPRQDEGEPKEPLMEDKAEYSPHCTQDFAIYETSCNPKEGAEEKSVLGDSGVFAKSNKKAKIARFLRLYFCPCCTCLYKIEKMNEDPSVYFTNSNEKD